MKTFYDLKKELHFNGLAGKLGAQDDLWTFYDILFSLQSDVIEASLEAYTSMCAVGQSRETAEKNCYAYHLMVRMLEHDMQKIEAFCRSRGIERK